MYDSYRKRGNKYFRTIANAYIDLCQFNAGNVKMINFQKIMMNTFLKSAKMLFHPCPFEGKHTFFNISPPNQVYSILNPGSIKFKLLFFDSSNYTLFSLTTFLKVTN